jgi:seryl-tRNA synthetase
VLDPRLIRSEPDLVREALRRRGEAESKLDAAVAIDVERRGLQSRVDDLRAERNAASEAIGAAMKAGRGDPAAAGQADAARTRVKALKDELDALEERLTAANATFDAAMLDLPNLVHPSVPDGLTEDDAETLALHGTRPTFGFAVRDHLELAGPLIDMERGSRTSGTRFSYLMGDVALLWMALSRYTVDTLVGHGFLPVNPPVLVRREALLGTGFLPGDGEQQIYKVPEDELYLVGTSEVALAALHMGEILDEADLPLRYCGISSCFRREAGSGGRDTRGIFRTHQFEKVEMFSFCNPERSWEEHDWLLSIEEEITRSLGLHYRVVNVAAGDLGAPAAKKYDIEVWLPGQDRYRELTSCSNTTEYQARRLQCRYRPSAGSPRPVHTLNGTAATSSRSIIAILETHQQEDGSIAVPAVLQRYGLGATLGPFPG